MIFNHLITSFMLHVGHVVHAARNSTTPHIVNRADTTARPRSEIKGDVINVVEDIRCCLKPGIRYRGCETWKRQCHKKENK